MAAIAFTAPVLPGKSEQATAFFQEVQRRQQEMTKSRSSLPGQMKRESVWVMHTPMGDFGIILLEGEDPVAANTAFAASQDPFDVWFKQTVKEFTGIDFGQPLPPIEQRQHRSHNPPNRHRRKTLDPPGRNRFSRRQGLRPQSQIHPGKIHRAASA